MSHWHARPSSFSLHKVLAKLLSVAATWGRIGTTSDARNGISAMAYFISCKFSAAVQKSALFWRALVFCMWHNQDGGKYFRYEAGWWRQHWLLSSWHSSSGVVASLWMVKYKSHVVTCCSDEALTDLVDLLCWKRRKPSCFLLKRRKVTRTEGPPGGFRARPLRYVIHF